MPNAGRAVTLPKFLYWAAIVLLVYRLALMAWSRVAMLPLVLPLPLAGGIFALLVSSFPIVLWSMLNWNVYRKPKRWGLGVGLLMLAGIALDLILLTLFPPYRASDWRAGQWLRYGFNVTPTLLCAGCCISLRWVYPAEGPDGKLI